MGFCLSPSIASCMFAWSFLCFAHAGHGSSNPRKVDMITTFLYSKGINRRFTLNLIKFPAIAGLGMGLTSHTVIPCNSQLLRKRSWSSGDSYCSIWMLYIPEKLPWTFVRWRLGWSSPMKTEYKPPCFSGVNPSKGSLPTPALLQVNNVQLEYGSIQSFLYSHKIKTTLQS